MNSLLCLSEIDEPHILHSELSLKQENRVIDTYCVLTENWFIIFKKKTDLISFKQIPLTIKTNVAYQGNQNQFIVSLGNFQFIFSNVDITLIENWIDEISKVINNSKLPNPLKDFDHTEVKINQMGSSNQDFHILIGHNDYKLYIFESLEYHRYHIPTHIISFKYYQLNNSMLRRKSSILYGTNKSLTLSSNQNQLTIKIKFKDEDLVSKWKNIFLNAPNYIFHNNDVGVLPDIYKNESNMFCADCGYPNPEWVSINLCLTICIDCAGSHRSLGTSYSRIQGAIMDQRIWEDSYVIKILQKIGNKKCNSFWLKNKPSNYTNSYDDPFFMKDKYVKKLFIDTEFKNLSEDELKIRLQESVTTDDVFLTMKLWQSYSFNDTEFIDNLLLIARNCQQFLQEKYLSLQPKIRSNESINSSTIIETVLQISCNNQNKINDLFLVTLLNDQISIKIEKRAVQPIEMVTVCCIPYDAIKVIWYDVNNECLVVFVNSVNIMIKLIDQTFIINKISFFNQSITTLKHFNIELMRCLLSNTFLNDELNLYFNLSVKFNSENVVKSQIYLTDQEIIFLSPISLKRNMKTSTNIMLLEENKAIDIKFDKENIVLITDNSDIQNIIRDCLEISAKQLVVEGDNIPIPIVKMIEFISFRGLTCEGIFRLGGAIKKINNLFNSIEKTNSDFYIDPYIYSINDVTSCLKKYFRSLKEPIITNKLLSEFIEYSTIEDELEKLNHFKNTLSKLPLSNMNIFRRLMELFLMIQLTVKINKMDSENLAISTAPSLISFENDQIKSSGIILKYFIDNFQILFDYSDKEFDTLKRFMANPEPPSTSIIRTFYASSYLNEFLQIKVSRNENLKFLRTIYVMISINIDNCQTVQDLCQKIFTNNNIQLWHFLTKLSAYFNETIKRLVHFNEAVSQSITYPKTLSNYENSYFIFMLQPSENNNKLGHRLFRCDIQLKLEKYQPFTLLMSYPKSLQIFDNNNQSNEPTYDLSLPDIYIYRFHERNVKKIFILHSQNKSLKCKFVNRSELQEFLNFYDQFRK